MPLSAGFACNLGSRYLPGCLVDFYRILSKPPSDTFGIGRRCRFKYPCCRLIMSFILLLNSPLSLVRILDYLIIVSLPFYSKLCSLYTSSLLLLSTFAMTILFCARLKKNLASEVSVLPVVRRAGPLSSTGSRHLLISLYEAFVQSVISTSLIPSSTQMPDTN